MADDFGIQMIAATFSSDNGADAALASFHEALDANPPVRVETAVVLRRDAAGRIDLERRPNLAGPGRRPYDGLVDAVIDMIVGGYSEDSLGPSSSALVALTGELSSVDAESWLVATKQPAVDAIQVTITARSLLAAGPGQVPAASIVGGVRPG